MTFAPLFSWHLIAAVAVILVGLCVLQIILINPRRSDSSKWSWVRRLIMSFSLIAIVLGPSIESTYQTDTVSDISVLFVIDNSGSMSGVESEAQDGNPTTRLDQVKDDVTNIVSYMPPSKYSAITFNSISTVALPLTKDLRAVVNWAQGLTPEITKYSKGTQLDSPESLMQKQILDIHETNPKDRIFVIFMSDGDSEITDDQIAQYGALDGQISSGIVLGYGTSDGAKMLSYAPDLTTIDSLLKIADPNSQKTATSGDKNYIKDPTTGNDAISKLDANSLERLSDSLGVKYAQRSSDETAENFAKDIYTNNWQFTPSYEEKVYTNLIVWPFYILFGLLLSYELFIFLSLGKTGRYKK
ncbi:hypothetical protein FACS1894125_3800 [Actinomycetota bacterium]|nr:hypothetical protein FACS1894125_3800 [Actinomycetota bacterium]